MGLVKPLELPNGAVTKTIGFPVSISNFQQADMQPPPELGADNLAVYDDWLGQNR
jgi:crotonobetainyl-CoA:carnitine CoA-transferase CaiB-like acyl-CoA transferase